jgi:hypothetical protein
MFRLNFIVFPTFFHSKLRAVLPAHVQYFLFCASIFWLENKILKWTVSTFKNLSDFDNSRTEYLPQNSKEPFLCLLFCVPGEHITRCMRAGDGAQLWITVKHICADNLCSCHHDAISVVSWNRRENYGKKRLASSRKLSKLPNVMIAISSMRLYDALVWLSNLQRVL